MSQRVRTDIEGDIARVTLTRAKAHNGVDQAMMDGVIAAAESLADEKSVRAVILSGEGPSFCAGIDVKAFFGKGMSLDLAKLYARLYSPMRNKFQQFSLAWRDLPIPVIAAVHGNCFGAGIQLALGADFRIVRPDAQLSVMEAKWGLVPDMGGAVLLRELVSADIARLLTYTGRVVINDEVAPKMVSGEEIQGSEMYFTTNPVVKTNDPELAWMNDTIFVGRMQRNTMAGANGQGHLVYDIYKVV